MPAFLAKVPAAPRDYAACSGCSLCLLVCPMWRSHRDPRFSAKGLAKALQCGATAADLAPPLEACSLCGACEPVCPERIGLVGLVSGLRQRLPHAAAEMADRGTAATDGPRGWLPKFQRRSLGETLSSKPAVRRRLGAADLYVIEPRAYHADYERLVKYYDLLQIETGCMLNLDLQRIAIPAATQAAWILQRRRPARIVVESPADRDAFESVCDIPVVHLADLAED